MQRYKTLDYNHSEVACKGTCQIGYLLLEPERVGHALWEYVWGGRIGQCEVQSDSSAAVQESNFIYTLYFSKNINDLSLIGLVVSGLTH